MKKNKFKPDAELLDFAKDFSSNYKRLKVGDYKSNSGKYSVSYINKIKDKDTGRIIHAVARVSHKTGIMELDRSWCLKQKKVTGNYIYYLIIWHAIIKWLSDNGSPSFMDADIITNELYLKTGRSKKDIAIGWLKLFSTSNNESNKERYEKINKMLLDAQKAEMERLESKKKKS
jgi:hypothetical protein